MVDIDEGWFKLPNSFVDGGRNARWTGAMVKVWLVLRRRAGKKMVCFPGIPDLCRNTGLCRNSVMEALKQLEGTGWIAVTRTKGKANYYTIGAE